MEIFGTNIFGIRRRETSPKPTVVTTEVPQSTVEQEPMKTGNYQEHIVRARSPQVALTVSAVYRAIELRASTMGVMPVQYRKRNSEKGNFQVDMRGVGKKINYLLQEEPNPLMSASDLWKQVTIAKLMFGNGFVYIERDIFGDPVYLWLAICGGYNEIAGTYNLTYLSDHGIIDKVNVPKRDVLHFPNTYRWMNGFWGIPTLQYAVETLSLIKTQKAQTLETAAKGGRVKMLIQEKDAIPTGTRGRANVNELKKITQQFDQDWANGDAIFLNNVAEAKPISLTSQDMQMIEQVGMGYDDVARFYATPRPLLMLDTNSHYNDYQNATMEYHTRTILPEKTDNEKEIARKLIGFGGYGTRDIHICEKPLLAMDPERKAKVAQLRLQTGLASVNELRAEDDMPSVEQGDIIYVSTNLAELGSQKLSGEVQQNITPLTGGEENEEKTDEGGTGTDTL